MEKRQPSYCLLAFGLAGLIVSISKIMFLGFGIGSAQFNFTGFIGHSAMSATPWPVMMRLISGRRSLNWRAFTIGLGYFIPLMVGLSRLVIHAHSVSEVLAGLLLGFTLSSAFLLSQRGTTSKGFSVAGSSCLSGAGAVNEPRPRGHYAAIPRTLLCLTGLEKPFHPRRPVPLNLDWPFRAKGPVFFI